MEEKTKENRNYKEKQLKAKLYTKEEKGVTLIALVVTIIVLIILAGITISTLLGDNGIIEKTRVAKDSQRGAAVYDEVELAVGENEMSYNIDGTRPNNKASVALDLWENKGYLTKEDYNKLTGSEGEDEIDEITIGNVTIDFRRLNGDGGGGGGPELAKGPNGKPLVNKDNIPETSHDKIIGEDEYGNQVVVPDGFKVADDSGTTVKDGIVIEDTQGNQYVWIPVSNINHDGSNKIKVNSASEEGVEITLGRYTFATSSPGDPTLAANSYQYANSYETPVTIDSYFQELTTHRDSNFSSGTDGTNTTEYNSAKLTKAEIRAKFKFRNHIQQMAFLKSITA